MRMTLNKKRKYYFKAKPGKIMDYIEKCVHEK